MIHIPSWMIHDPSWIIHDRSWMIHDHSWVPGIPRGVPGIPGGLTWSPGWVPGIPGWASWTPMERLINGGGAPPSPPHPTVFKFVFLSVATSCFFPAGKISTKNIEIFQRKNRNFLFFFVSLCVMTLEKHGTY